MMNGSVNKAQVIDFLIQSEALKFGEFILKSGRKAPYFVNTGCFNDGAKISQLSRFYAQQIVSLGLEDVDVLFGPAYKGIPLCVATAMSLAHDFGRKVGFCFNRKEVKTHGDGGEFVGVPLKSEMRVVLVEDVVTAGTTLNEVVPMLRDRVGVQIAGVVILVDREEKGKGDLSAVQEAEQELGVSVSSIVTIRDVISYLSGSNSSGFMIDDTMRARIEEYRAQYGVACVHG